MKAKIFFIERNIRGAWVVYGSEGIKQYYGYTKQQAKEMYQNDNRTFVNEKRRMENDKGKNITDFKQP